MNETEAKALEWICREYKVNAGDVQYRHNESPDFILPSGVGLEVKKTQHPTCHTILFGLRQWQSLEKQKDVFVLVFYDSDEPDAVIPFNEIDPKTRKWGAYHMVITNGVPGVIERNDWLRLSKTLPHYTLEDKAKRNKELVEMTENRLDLSWRQIGKEFGISGARAWVIYKRCKGK